ncbi:hypothetical protein B5K06_21775 [Rhizobium grahamii]|uniref:Uncharacterized protein n=1 Tax=Rhizobium grahamii TaxID=1120045 RepID=A0A370KLH3_9HYPH|nr:hypothetical protein B5K06_21775 [Rhizobium grahamii]
MSAFVTFTLFTPLQCRLEAHDAARGWTYPPACCRGRGQGGDCDAIPRSDVSKLRRGYSIILQPGDHFRATRSHRFFVPYGDELPSGDGDFHLCLHPSEDYLDCFFAPPDSV